MSQPLGIETLIEKRESLVFERNNAISRFDNEIGELDSCIELLSGKKLFEVLSEEKFDDTNPNYIKASAEEI